MVRLQRVAVSSAEGGGELVGGVLEVAADALRGEVEAAGGRVLEGSWRFV